MNRWLLPIIAVIFVVIPTAAVRSHIRSVAKKKREMAYEATLQRYARELKPGLRRKEVESYLSLRKIAFSWKYTAFGGRTESQYADLVKIGEESAPWYCGKEYVYVALEFSFLGKYDQNDSDVLERIEIFQPDSDCL